MDRQEGIRQIDEAQWKDDHDGCLGLHVSTSEGLPVHAWLTLRPVYCDRGHIQLNIDGPLDLDRADSFPRYFFSFNEADWHTRTFLKWRLWQKRMTPDAALRDMFETPELQVRVKAIRDTMAKDGP